MTDAELRRRAVEPAKNHPWQNRVLRNAMPGFVSYFRPGSALVTRLNRGPFPEASECEMGIQWKQGPRS